MKITGGKGVDLYIKKLAGKKRAGKATDSSAALEQTDKVEISQAGADIIKAKEAVKNSPDVRADKVEQVKREIDDGSYKVKEEKVAEKIIHENILDELL